MNQAAQEETVEVQDEQPLTSRQKYLLEQEQINAANAKENALHADEDDQVLDAADAIEKTIDKNMGDVKVPASTTHEMTREEYLEVKETQKTKQAITAMQQHQAKHLSKEEQESMKKVLDDFEQGKIDDPVLKFLVEEKIKTAKVFVASQIQMKELHERVLRDTTLATEEAFKVRGAMETVDRQILQRGYK